MDRKKEPFTLWHGLLLGEAMALIIALALTIVPGKTGSDTGISGSFFDDPTFFEEFLINAVFSNVILILLVVIIAVWWNRRGGDQASPPRG